MHPRYASWDLWTVSKQDCRCGSRYVCSEIFLFAVCAPRQEKSLEFSYPRYAPRLGVQTVQFAKGKGLLCYPEDETPNN